MKPVELQLSEEKSVNNLPGWCVHGKCDTTTMQHASVVQANIRVISTDSQQFRSHWIDAQTLGFGMWTYVLIQIDQHILRPISLAHFRSTQVKLPVFYRNITRGLHTAQTRNKISLKTRVFIMSPFKVQSCHVNVNTDKKLRYCRDMAHVIVDGHFIFRTIFWIF